MVGGIYQFTRAHIISCCLSRLLTACCAATTAQQLGMTSPLDQQPLHGWPASQPEKVSCRRIHQQVLPALNIAANVGWQTIQCINTLISTAQLSPILSIDIASCIQVALRVRQQGQALHADAAPLPHLTNQSCHAFATAGSIRLAASEPLRSTATQSK